MVSEITLLALSPSMTDGTVAHWYKQAGDTVLAGEPLVDIETAKTVLEMESPASGTIEALLVAVGDEVDVGASIVRLVGEGDDSRPVIHTESVAPAQLKDKVTPAANQEISAGTEPRDEPRRRISPRARKLMEAEGVVLDDVVGSGPGGRIVERDVQQQLAAAVELTVSPVKAELPDSTLVPHSRTRRYIADRLQEAKQHIPHFYLDIDCEVDDLVAFRSRCNGEPGRALEDRLSLNDFVIRALAMALRDVPELNGRWEEAGVRRFDTVDLAIAVATPDGLLTPVLKDVARKGLLAISRETRELARRARAGELRPEEYSGGGFTLSNLGMYGVRHFSAIVNPPQIGILAVGAVERRAVVRGDALEIASVMSVTLSVDHRAVDGAEAARFLAALRRYLEESRAMLL